DGLAMQQDIAVSRLRFERVAEGMAQVEQRALSGFTLVGGDDCRLDSAAVHDRMPASGGIAVADRSAMPLQPDEEIRVADQAVLDDFGISGEQLALGQGVENAGVGEHQARLMEGPDEILAVSGIDAGLSADGTVDLSQQGRRDLHEVKA